MPLLCLRVDTLTSPLACHLFVDAITVYMIGNLQMHEIDQVMNKISFLWRLFTNYKTILTLLLFKLQKEILIKLKLKKIKTNKLNSNRARTRKIRKSIN